MVGGSGEAERVAVGSAGCALARGEGGWGRGPVGKRERRSGVVGGESGPSVMGGGGFESAAGSGQTSAAG